jgi:hypothetical protein
LNQKLTQIDIVATQTNSELSSKRANRGINSKYNSESFQSSNTLGKRLRRGFQSQILNPIQKQLRAD